MCRVQPSPSFVFLFFPLIFWSTVSTAWAHCVSLTYDTSSLSPASLQIFHVREQLMHRTYGKVPVFQKPRGVTNCNWGWGGHATLKAYTYLGACALSTYLLVPTPLHAREAVHHRGWLIWVIFSRLYTCSSWSWRDLLFPIALCIHLCIIPGFM